MTEQPALKPFQPTEEFWAIVEVFGHQKHVGKVSEVTFAGTPFIQLIDARDGAKRLLGGASVFRLTLCTEEQAKHAAAPMLPWEPSDFDDPDDEYDPDAHRYDDPDEEETEDSTLTGVGNALACRCNTHSDIPF